MISFCVQIKVRLFASPLLRRPLLLRQAKALKVTARAAAQNVERLVKLGVLEEATGRKRGRVFVAREVIQVLGRRWNPEQKRVQ